MPVAREILRFAAVTPRARFHEKVRPGRIFINQNRTSFRGSSADAGLSRGCPFGQCHAVPVNHFAHLVSPGVATSKTKYCRSITYEVTHHTFTLTNGFDRNATVNGIHSCVVHDAIKWTTCSRVVECLANCCYVVVFVCAIDLVFAIALPLVKRRDGDIDMHDFLFVETIDDVHASATGVRVKIKKQNSLCSHI